MTIDVRIFMPQASERGRGINAFASGGGGLMAKLVPCHVQDNTIAGHEGIHFREAKVSPASVHLAHLCTRRIRSRLIIQGFAYLRELS